MKVHTINDVKYTVLGGITTAQQFDFGRMGMYNFVKRYAEAVRDGVNSIFLAFPNTKEMHEFLASILVPEGEQWSIEVFNQTQKVLAKRMIEPKVLEGVVDDFFVLNAEWVGISPALREVQTRMMGVITTALLKENTEGSADIAKTLKSLSTFMTTFSGQQTAT